jgi:hypothetical protein
MVRKVSEQEAQAKQQEMAQATIRRINRRIRDMPDNQLRDFLLACRADVTRAITPA